MGSGADMLLSYKEKAVVKQQAEKMDVAALKDKLIIGTFVERDGPGRIYETIRIPYQACERW